MGSIDTSLPKTPGPETDRPAGNRRESVAGSSGTRAAHNDISTDGPVEAASYLQSLYPGAQCQLFNSSSPFRFEAGNTRDTSLSLEHLRADGRGRIRLQPDESTLAVLVVRGAATVIVGDSDERHDLDKGQALLFGPGTVLEINWDNIAVVVVRLDAAEMQRIADRAPSRRWEPDASVAYPAGVAQLTHLETTIGYARRAVFSRADIARSPLVRRSTIDMLAAAMLNTFGGDLDHDIDRADLDEDVPPSVLRACRFFDAEARSPIGVMDAAAETKVSPRTLQASFQRHLGVTPSQYLTSVRLAGARKELRDGDPAAGLTVDQVRRTWHFSNAGRFAQLYRDAFDELPRETLGR